MVNYIVVISVVLIAICIGGLVSASTGLVIDEEDEFDSVIISKIADLPISTDLNFDDYTEYVSFAKKTNDLIEILNEAGLDLKQFDLSNDGYIKLKGFISDIDSGLTKWGPLVGNYNELVESAKLYDSKKTRKNKESFYKATIRFGVESAIIGGAVFYKATYKTVGSLYRASGLSRYAAKNPKLVSSILSMSHWEIRNGLVIASAEILRRVETGDYEFNFEIISDETWVKINQSKASVGEFVNEKLSDTKEKVEEIKKSEEYQELSANANESFQNAKKGFNNLLDKTLNTIENL